MNSQIARKKVFFDAFPLGGQKLSGIGHMIHALIKTLSEDAALEEFRQGHEIVLVASPKVLETSKQLWRFKNVTYISVGVKGRIFNALVLKRLMPPVDWFLGSGTYVFGNYTTWPLSKRSRAITYVHDLAFIYYPETMRPKVLKALKRNVARWIARADKVVTISKNTEKELQEHFGLSKSKLSVIYPGVDTAHYYPRPKNEIAKVKHAYGIKGPYILFVSNLEPRKNVIGLVDAFAMLPGELRKQYALVLVGAESWGATKIYQAIHQAQSNGINIIHPDSYVPDAGLPALYSGATCLVHPAFYEGFGISPLQALACGTPVVASNAASLPEVVGTAAVLVNPSSTKDISSAIEKVLADPQLRQQLSQKGIAWASQWPWQKSATELAKLIENTETPPKHMKYNNLYIRKGA